MGSLFSHCLELAQLEKLIMTWPCSIRLKRRIAEERAAIARIEEAKLRALRGRIRRSLSHATLDQLAAAAVVMESAS